MNQKGSVEMIAAKRQAGDAPEMNLRNPLHTGNEAWRPGIHPGL